MTLPALPLSHPFDLASVSDGGMEVTLHPSAEARAAIAKWADALSIPAFEGTCRLRRSGQHSYVCVGHFEAEIVQSCVVTLAPVTTRLSGDFVRRYRVVSTRSRSKTTVDITVEADGEDDTETVQSPVIDLAVPLLEEFALAIDPYPRAPGAALPIAADPESEAPNNPFEVLGRLKSGGKDTPPGGQKS